MSDDPIVAFLTARLDDEQRTAEAATQGRWFWAEPSKDSWPCGDEPLVATDGEWYSCPYFCSWTGPSDVHRGEPDKPGHEHLRTTEVVGAWGHDAYGVDAGEADQRHIVAWQPSRVLADVEAKRAILAEHTPGTDRCDEHDGATLKTVPCPTLLALVGVYSGHPDFDPLWARSHES